MASITQRAVSGTWQAQVRRKGYETMSRTFDSKRDAEDWARQVEHEMARGVFVDRTEAERTTLADALERYRREIVPAKRHPDQENQRINRWLDYPITKRSLANLRGSDFAAYRDARRAAGRAENTIRLELALISHVFEIARKEWRMEGLNNPLKDVRKPGSSKARDRRLRPRGVPAALQAARALRQRLRGAGDGPRDRDGAAPGHAVRAALGMGEPRAARDRDSGQVPGCRQQGRAQGLAAVQPGAEVIRRLHPKRDDGTLADRPTGPALPTTQNAVVMAFKKVKAAHVAQCEAEGRAPLLVDLRWHDLRHEATSRLVKRMRNLLHVRAITGHKSMQMLARYDHPEAEELLAQMG